MKKEIIEDIGKSVSFDYHILIYFSSYHEIKQINQW